MWPFVMQQIGEKPIFGYGYDVAGAIFQSRYFLGCRPFGMRSVQRQALRDLPPSAAALRFSESTRRFEQRLDHGTAPTVRALPKS
jgi:hypothetical protein